MVESQWGKRIFFPQTCKSFDYTQNIFPKNRIFILDHAKGMLVIIIRSLIIFIFLVLGLRLMGKRTLGELQPFEFVIVLAVADLACVPMSDLSTPITYGIIPLITLFIANHLVTGISVKSIKFRKVLNGKPLIVIDTDGINHKNLKDLGLNVNDLLQMIRQQGYFSIQEIKFAIIETNGKLSIMENEQESSPNSVPTTIIVEGRFLDKNSEQLNIHKEDIERIVREKNYKVKDILLLTVDSNKVFMQPKDAKYLTFEVA